MYHREITIRLSTLIVSDLSHTMVHGNGNVDGANAISQLVKYKGGGISALGFK